MGHEHIHGNHSHEHTHSHTHEHTHDGHTHSHEHDHIHEHDHQHPHTHDHLHEAGHSHEHSHEHSHHHHEHSHEHGAAPMAQLCALMNYMVDHNAAHANELTELAEQLKSAGKEVAYEKVMSAVADFKKGNDTLAEVLRSLAE